VGTVGLKYRRFGVVALSVGLLLSMAGAGAAMAADPPADGIVWDGVVKVLWVDRVDGIHEGATVRVFFYRDGDPIQGIMPGSWTTDSRGLATITGVPRPIAGADPVRLDIRADLSTAIYNPDTGCSTYQDWIGQSIGVRSRESILLLMHTTYRSEPFVNCVFG
jgi:hypothetical protein